MATKKKATPAKTTKKSAADKLLDRLLKLKHEGQISLNCQDARDAFADIYKLTGTARTVASVKLELSLQDIEIAAGDDPNDEQSYVLDVRDSKGKVIATKIQPDFVDIEDAGDYAEDDEY